MPIACIMSPAFYDELVHFKDVYLYCYNLEKACGGVAIKIKI